MTPAPEPSFEQLYPAAGPADLATLYAPPDAARHVRLNMIASVDGATALGGRSGSLGGPADKVLFSLLRSFADVIVVGAGTMRTERYGPARVDPAQRRAREGRGQAPVPPIAVVSGRVDFDWAAPFFAEAEAPPLLITGAAGAARVPKDAPVADVVVAGDEHVDLAEACAQLATAGYRQALVEGGPTINAAVAAGAALDELCLTVAPLVVGGTSARILNGPDDTERHLRVASIVRAEGYLFFRYLRAGPDAA